MATVRALFASLALGASATALDAGAGLSSMRTLPPNPVAGEPFAILVTGDAPGSSVTLTGIAATIQGSVVSIESSIASTPANPPANVIYRGVTSVAGLPAGTYRIVATEAGQPTGDIGSVTVIPAPPVPADVPRGLSGNWFNDEETGWGVNVVQGDSGALFVVWLTYEAVADNTPLTSQNPTWLVMPAGRWITPSEFRGLLYRTTANPTVGGFVPGTLVVAPVGYVSMQFTSPMQAQFYGEGSVAQIPVFTKLKPVRRMAF